MSKRKKKKNSRNNPHYFDYSFFNTVKKQQIHKTAEQVFGQTYYISYETLTQDQQS